MITRIRIDGFKSFQNFQMTFTPLTLIAGTNASGKSNLFDALKLLSRLSEADLKTAFTDQRGNPIELFTQYSEDSFASEMEFVVDLFLNRKIRDNWGEEAELNNTRLRYRLIIERKPSSYGFEDLSVKYEHLEKIKIENDEIVKKLPASARPLWKTMRAGGSKKPFIETLTQAGKATIKIRQDGKQGGKATLANTAKQTVLSGINSVDFPHVFAVKEEMRNWKFLQLNPEDLREPTRKDIGLRDTISQSGNNLASALYRIKMTDEYNLKEISRKLNSFLPNIIEVNVYDDEVNNQYIIKIRGEDGNEFSSRVLSEGTLRLLALCILDYDDKFTGLLCFEEPENGIHPFRINAMAKLLKDLSVNFENMDMPLRQVIVNTHSPSLVGEIIQWRDDITVGVWLSRLNSLITEKYGNKQKLKVSKMSPVIKDKSPKQLSFFDVSEPEIKVTLREVIDYLQSVDSESVSDLI